MSFFKLKGHRYENDTKIGDFQLIWFMATTSVNEARTIFKACAEKVRKGLGDLMLPGEMRLVEIKELSALEALQNTLHRFHILHQRFKSLDNSSIHTIGLSVAIDAEVKNFCYLWDRSDRSDQESVVKWLSRKIWEDSPEDQKPDWVPGTEPPTILEDLAAWGAEYHDKGAETRRLEYEGARLKEQASKYETN